MPKSDINENREKYSPGLLYGVVLWYDHVR